MGSSRFEVCWVDQVESGANAESMGEGPPRLLFGGFISIFVAVGIGVMSYGIHIIVKEAGLDYIKATCVWQDETWSESCDQNDGECSYSCKYVVQTFETGPMEFSVDGSADGTSCTQFD